MLSYKPILIQWGWCLSRILGADFLRQRQELQNLTDIAMHLKQTIDATVNTHVTEIQWLINYIRAHVLPTVHNNQHASNLITACINQWQTSLDSIEI